MENKHYLILETCEDLSNLNLIENRHYDNLFNFRGIGTLITTKNDEQRFLKK